MTAAGRRLTTSRAVDGPRIGGCTPRATACGGASSLAVGGDRLRPLVHRALGARRRDRTELVANRATAGSRFDEAPERRSEGTSRSKASRRRGRTSEVAPTRSSNASTAAQRLLRGRATDITASVREPLLQIAEPNRPCRGHKLGRNP